MKQTLIENIRETQGFDKALRAGGGVPAVIAEAAPEILGTTKRETRDKAIVRVETRLVDQFEHTTQPAAERIGREAAVRVVRKLPAARTAAELSESGKARRFLEAGYRGRASDRIAVVKNAINDSANTLSNRLANYFLSPESGATEREKLARLRDAHHKSLDAEIAYQKKLSAFTAGETATRPRPPTETGEDFLTVFQRSVTADFREQARRAGTDAETTAFETAGYDLFLWVVVGGKTACPDCRRRSGVVLKMSQWRTWGVPGAGRTICGMACLCMLVPAETARVAPSVTDGIDLADVNPVLETKAAGRFFAKHRS